MAARNRCHERLFRIDRSRNRIWKGHARRRRGRWYFNASIEAPDVPAAVSVVDEGNALPLPFDRCVIFVCHVQFTQSGPGQIVRAEVQPRILGGALDLTVARTPESAVTYSYYDGLTSEMPFFPHFRTYVERQTFKRSPGYRANLPPRTVPAAF